MKDHDGVIAITALGGDLLAAINASCPDTRTRELAIANVQQGMMWAERSIEIGAPPPPPPPSGRSVLDA